MAAPSRWGPDVLPVFAGEVLHETPHLKLGSPAFSHHESVGRLPHRRLGEIPHPQVVIRPVERKHDRLEILLGILGAGPVDRGSGSLDRCASALGDGEGRQKGPDQKQADQDCVKVLGRRV